MKRPVILCPLGIERRAIAKSLKDRADVRLIGPGPAAIKAAMELLTAEKPPLVILFGLAGGLRDDETAPRIGRVVDKDARGWIPTCIPPGDSDTVTVVGMDEPVLSRTRKKQMAGAYAAALVDTESHIFAQSAVAAGLHWGVVRGISDGPNDELPAAVTEWVDARGRMRLGRVILGTILNPGVIPGVITLFRKARPALRAAAGRLIETINVEMTGTNVNSFRPTVVLPKQSSASNPIERQLGRKSARLNDPPATPTKSR